MPPEAQESLLILAVQDTGQDTAREYLVQKGRTTVGRTSAANLVFPSDTYLSGLHFAIDWDGARCRVVDLRSSNGTFLNDQRVAEADISDGTQLQAGKLLFHFTIRLQAASPDGQAALPQTPDELALCENLFAIVDATQDIRLPGLLSGQDVLSRSLFERNAEAEYSHVAPYLVSFLPGSPLARYLIATGWDRNWAIYFRSAAAFDQVRSHFRRFLMVAQNTGRIVYFRFYDPRVLRVFLSVSSYTEAQEFLGAVEFLWVAGPEPGSMIQFDLQRVGLFSHDPRVTAAGQTTVFRAPGMFVPAVNG